MKRNLFLLAFLMIAVMLSSCVKDDPAPQPEPPPPPPPGDPVLVHYWHFNNLPNITFTEPIESDFSQFGLTASMDYPGTGEGTWDIRTHRPADPVSNFNLRMGQGPDQGAVIRLRNPANTRELLITAPSNGYEKLVVTFAATRSENGAKQQEFYFSADGGSSWTLVGEAYYIPSLPENEGYVEKVIDLSEYAQLNDNASTMFKILFVGEGSDNASGNNRFDNFSIDGVPLASGDPAKLAISSVNDGDPVFANEPFSLLIYSLDADNSPASVANNLTVNLSLESGTGNLGGTLSGVIASGENSVLITGITYNAAGTGIKIKAEAQGLTASISEAFDVALVTYNLQLSLNLPEAGTLTGDGVFVEGEEVTIGAVANEGFMFINWTRDGEEFSAEASHTFTMPAENLSLVANFEAVAPGLPMLVYYWHFNNQNDPTLPIVADFAADGLSAFISYPGTGDGYLDYRTVRPQDPASNLNLRMGQEPDQGAVLRVRNPAEGRVFLIEAPSTGYTDIVVAFAITRSSELAGEQQFYYSPDAGNTWVAVGDVFAAQVVPAWDLITIDLSGYNEVNNNPNLQLKIEYSGDAIGGDSGNNRYDNITIDGIPVQ
jgi:hypothetical protein